MTGFWCQNCDRVCCWECSTPDASIEVIKTIASRFCNSEECIQAERIYCNCKNCRSPDFRGPHRVTGNNCKHHERTNGD